MLKLLEILLNIKHVIQHSWVYNLDPQNECKLNPEHRRGAHQKSLQFELLMFNSSNALPGPRECQTRIQLNKRCRHVVSIINFADYEAHSCKCVDPIKQIMTFKRKHNSPAVHLKNANIIMHAKFTYFQNTHTHANICTCLCICDLY